MKNIKLILHVIVLMIGCLSPTLAKTKLLPEWRRDLENLRFGMFINFSPTTYLDVYDHLKSDSASKYQSKDDLTETHKKLPEEYSNRAINFNRPNGSYTNDILRDDFGNGIFPEGRGFASIQDNVYKITFNKGEKVSKTGAAVQVKITPARQYTLQYRIQYDKNFQEGLHGKQFGFNIGVGYDGGRGEEARQNGDGGSVRIQFDVHGDSISNQLYVYSCEMKGTYGNNTGEQKYSFKKGEWNTIRLTVTMQSAETSKDGRIEVWCNGKKKIDVKELKFVRFESANWITRLAFESFPGGGGAIPAYDNYLYVDDLQWYKGK